MTYTRKEQWMHLSTPDLQGLAQRLNELADMMQAALPQSSGPDECPRCGLYRNTVRAMLLEPVDSDNYQLALHIPGGCSECRAAIKIPERRPHERDRTDPGVRP